MRAEVNPGILSHPQARNQEFFRAGEFSWNYGTLINIHLQHEKERSHREKISVFFSWKLLKITF